MAFDFKKEYREFYLPGRTPQIVTVPPAAYIAVRGRGDPNEPGGAYQQAVGVLYAVAYTIRMSCKGTYKIDGFYEYVVPPLEGFWWQDGVDGADLCDKGSFNWISVIRLPEFVRRDDFDWAVAEASRKKKLDCASAELLSSDEGLCVQIMHVGSFDNEPAAVALMDEYIAARGYVKDFSDSRLHHEIYLSDPRRVDVAARRTVIRHPIKLG